MNERKCKDDANIREDGGIPVVVAIIRDLRGG